MTFFELEKECKKKKIKNLLFGIIFIILIFVIGLYFYNLTTKNVHIKNKIKKIKEINQTKKINIPIKIKKANQKIEILKPIIDLNISNLDKKEQTTEKEKENTVVKPETNKNQKLILNSSNLPSFETCIKLAENFYKNKDYENALKWAKNANIQNRKDPRSWIIVAKSLYKMGKKDKAVQILQIYYKYTKNSSVLRLIERMKNGEN